MWSIWSQLTYEFVYRYAVNRCCLTAMNMCHMTHIASHRHTKKCKKHAHETVMGLVLPSTELLRFILKMAQTFLFILCFHCLDWFQVPTIFGVSWPKCEFTVVRSYERTFWPCGRSHFHMRSVINRCSVSVLFLFIYLFTTNPIVCQTPILLFHIWNLFIGSRFTGASNTLRIENEWERNIEMNSSNLDSLPPVFCLCVCVCTRLCSHNIFGSTNLHDHEFMNHVSLVCTRVLTTPLSMHDKFSFRARNVYVRRLFFFALGRLRRARNVRIDTNSAFAIVTTNWLRRNKFSGINGFDCAAIALFAMPNFQSLFICSHDQSSCIQQNVVVYPAGLDRFSA